MPSSQHRKERRENNIVVDYYTDEKGSVYYVDCEICKELGQAIGEGGVIREVDTLTPHYRVQTPVERLCKELHEGLSFSDEDDEEGNNETEQGIRELIQRAYDEGVKDGSKSVLAHTDAGRKEMHTH